MLFTSTPSLLMYMILAVFYVANVIVYVVNCNRGVLAEQPVETVCIIHNPAKLSELPGHTIYYYQDEIVKQEVFQVIQTFWYAAYLAAAKIHIPHTLPDTPVALSEGICYSLFQRPPPLG